MPPNPSPRRKLAKTKTASKSEKPSASSKPQDDSLKNAPESPEAKAAEKLSTEFEKKVGLSAESLKKLFTAEKPTEEVKKLKQLARDRCVSMRTFSLRDWRTHVAEDEAYGASFRQTTPTLLGKILNSCGTQKQIEESLCAFGIPESALFTPVYGPDGKTVKEKILTRDTLVNVKVPITKSLVNARESRLFAERDVEPFMSFEMTKSSEEWQVVGEIITKLVSQMSAGFDYKAVFRGVNHQGQKYGSCFMFPVESWYVEQDEDGKTVKEGFRYNYPPPTRVGYDQTYRPSTINSDTGCEWLGYWGLKRWGDVDQNPAYYNKDKVSYSATNWIADGAPYKTYFEWVYPCNFPLPYCGMPKGKDREAKADIYSQGDYDKGIFETNMFMKLSPKQYGLSDYKPKLWIRFVLAGDGDIIYAEPVPYTPALYLGTDADDSVSNSVPSFCLETIPWHDLVGNVLSDILNAMKQNSIKVIFYDKYQITEEKIQEMMAKARQSGQALWFPMDWKDLMRGQVNIDLLFKSFTFPLQNIGEKIATLNTVFNVMERGLGISAQETGAIAGHTQTRGEIEVISSNISTRLGLQLSMADDFFDAWKRQIVTGMKWFMDEDFAVEVSAAPQEVIDRMKKEFGFEFKSIGKDRMRVEGKKSKLSVDAFLSTREGRTRQSNPQIAQVMFQALAAISANQDMAMRIGPAELVKLYNRAFAMAGMPEDSKFKLDPEAATLMENKKVLAAIEELSKQMLAASKQEAAATAQKVTQQAGEQVVNEVAPAIKQVGEAAAQAGQAAGEAQQGVQAVAQQGQQTDEQLAQAIAAQNQDIQTLSQQIAQMMQSLETIFAAAGQPQAIALSGNPA